MSRRIGRNIVLALSAGAVVAVIGLAVYSRTDDLVVSYARGGKYRELRIGFWEISVSNVALWPKNEPLKSGRAPNPTVFRPLNAGLRELGLLNNTTIMPTRVGRSPLDPLWITGTADVLSPTTDPDVARVTSYPLNRFALPVWTATGALSVPWWLTLLGAGLGRLRRNARRFKGLCEQCGYDLRGSSERCPECGLRIGGD